MPKKLEDAVVRYEFCGPVIWSFDKGKYFIPVVPDMNQITVRAIKDLKNDTYDARQYPAGFEQELRTLGLGGKVRELTSDSNNILSAPLEVYFDYTWSCNLANKKCGQKSNCYAAPYLGKMTMKPEQVRDIMSEMRDLGVMRVHLAGGEPTIFPVYLDNYMRAAYDNGLIASMASNGTLMSESTARMLLQYNIYSVSFGIDGHDEESYSAIRGEGVFAQAKQGLKTFLKVRDETGAKTLAFVKPTYGPNTRPENLEAMIQFALDNGADSVKLNNPERCLFHPKGYYGNIREDYYRMAFFAVYLREKYKDKISILTTTNPLTGGCREIGLPGFNGCIGGQELITINPNGQVTPCLMHRFDLGNVNNYQSIADLWHNSAELSVFRNLSAQKPTQCVDCNIYSSCRSGSNVRKIVQNEDFAKTRTTGRFKSTSDPLCPKEFMSTHPEAALSFAESKGKFRYFKAVHVAHSL